MLRDAARVRAASSRLSIFAGIRLLTVPVGTACLRISLTLNVGEAGVHAMHDALFERRAVKFDDTRTMIRRFGIISTAPPK